MTATSDQPGAGTAACAAEVLRLLTRVVVGQLTRSAK